MAASLMERAWEELAASRQPGDPDRQITIGRQAAEKAWVHVTSTADRLLGVRARDENRAPRALPAPGGPRRPARAPPLPGNPAGAPRGVLRPRQRPPRARRNLDAGRRGVAPPPRGRAARAAAIPHSPGAAHRHQRAGRGAGFPGDDLALVAPPSRWEDAVLIPRQLLDPDPWWDPAFRAWTDTSLALG